MNVLVPCVVFAAFLSLTSGGDATYSIHEIPEAIIANGYPAERHHVVTEDGYILEMHRIPRGKNDPSSKRPVVFLMHGLLSSSQSFIVLGPENGVAYNLADAGFDVWMGNARGNRLSRNHTSLNPDDSKEKFQFFDFSFEEIGMIDVAAMIDYALEVSGQSQLHYIGHSQGGTVFLVLTSMKREYNEKIKSAHLLAGVGYQDHFPNQNLSRLSLITDIIYQMSLSLGVVELFPPNNNNTKQETGGTEKVFCTGDPKYVQICELLGMSEIVTTSDKKPRSEVAGAALKQVAHFGQNIRDKSFRRWNFGALKNLAVYGQLLPPKYDLTLIKTNVTMHYTTADTLLDEEDVLAMAADIPNASVRKVANDSFLHGDFVAADNCKELVTDYIIQALRQVEAQVPTQIMVKDEPLDTIQSSTFFGITLDQKLQWGPHIETLSGKLSSAAYAVRKIRLLTDVETARSAAQKGLTETAIKVPNGDVMPKDMLEVIPIEPPVQSSSSSVVLSMFLKTCFFLFLLFKNTLN